MNKYNIWIEGWEATGGSEKARLIAEHMEGQTFESAVVAFAETPLAERLGDFDKEKLSFWGCRVFDNEIDARKSFG